MTNFSSDKHLVAKNDPTKSAILADASPSKAGKERLSDIDRAKGLAIILVVWGHVPSDAIGDAPLWYLISISTIYSFHMPLFIYLSGFLYFFSRGPDRFWGAPTQQILSRFNRLMVPFVGLALFVVAGKYFTNSLDGISDPVSSFSEGVMDVVTNAPNNPILSVWYLFVLFVYTVVTPVLWKLGRGTTYLIIIIGIIGWIFPLTEEFYIRRIAVFYIFFGIGGVCAIHYQFSIKLISKLFPLSLMLFLASMVALYDTEYALLVCGVPSLFAVHGLFLRKFWRRDRLLLSLGRYSMVIYLFNTIFIGLGKVVAPPSMLDDSAGFLAVVISLFLVGIAGPIVVRIFVEATPVLRHGARYLR